MDIQLRSSGSLLVGCFYRPPNGDASAFAEALESSVNRIDLRHTFVLLVGDFNAKSPSWLSSDGYNAAGRVLEPAFLQLGLHQCVSTPTHITPAGALGSLLDLALVSSPAIVHSVETHPPLGSSDHLVVHCKLDLRAERAQRSQGRTIWNYDNVDFNIVNKALATADWSSSFQAADVDTAWSSWQSTFLSTINK